MKQDDQLWELLGRAKAPSVSPFFARNVLRAVRQEQAAAPAERIRLGFVRLFRDWSWRVALAVTCVAATIVTVLPFPRMHRHMLESTSALAVKVVGDPDYEVIKHLDELAADEESSVWLDDSVD